MAGFFDSLELCLGATYAYEVLEHVHGSSLAALAADYGLTPPELTAIYTYTLGRTWEGLKPFERINRCLRYPYLYGAERNFVDPLVYQLISGLTKLPPYRGHTFRRTDLPEETMTEAKNRIFRDAGFLSCSSEADVFNGRDLLIARSLTGREVGKFSDFPSEHEVIFLPNTTFEVSRLDLHSDNAILVLNEVAR